MNEFSGSVVIAGVTILALAGLLPADNISVRDAAASVEQVKMAATPEFTVEDAVFEKEDCLDFGNVIVLDDGTVLLETGGELITDENGEVIFIPKQVGGLQLTSTITRSTAPVLKYKFEDVEFDLQWRDDGSGQVTVFLDGSGDAIVSLEVTDITFPQLLKTSNAGGSDVGSSCSTTCRNGDCDINCAGGKACIAYCDEGNPVCQCIKKPAMVLDHTGIDDFDNPDDH